MKPHTTLFASFILLLWVSCADTLIAAQSLLQARPNVVLVVTDDQYLFGFLDGKDYTPNIDRLAAEGMYFSRAYTTAVCTPSRWNILTGRYASRCTSDATLDNVSETWSG